MFRRQVAASDCTQRLSPCWPFRYRVASHRHRHLQKCHQANRSSSSSKRLPPHKQRQSIQAFILRPHQGLPYTICMHWVRLQFKQIQIHGRLSNQCFTLDPVSSIKTIVRRIRKDLSRTNTLFSSMSTLAFRLHFKYLGIVKWFVVSRTNCSHSPIFSVLFLLFFELHISLRIFCIASLRMAFFGCACVRISVRWHTKKSKERERKEKIETRNWHEILFRFTLHLFCVSLFVSRTRTQFSATIHRCPFPCGAVILFVSRPTIETNGAR